MAPCSAGHPPSAPGPRGAADGRGAGDAGNPSRSSTPPHPHQRRAGGTSSSPAPGSPLSFGLPEAELFVISVTHEEAARLLSSRRTPWSSDHREGRPAIGDCRSHRPTRPHRRPRSRRQLLGSADDHLGTRPDPACGVVGPRSPSAFVRAVLDQVSGYDRRTPRLRTCRSPTGQFAFMVAIAIDLDAMRLATWRVAALLDAGMMREAVAHARTLTSVHAPASARTGCNSWCGHRPSGVRQQSGGIRTCVGQGMIEEWSSHDRTSDPRKFRPLLTQARGMARRPLG